MTPRSTVVSSGIVSVSSKSINSPTSGLDKQSTEISNANPAEGVRLPPAKKGKYGKPYMTPDQFQQLIQLISEPYASMIYVAVYTGLRASELVGLRWKNVHADSITIDERYSGGEWGPPKSDASNATIAVNQCVLERIHRLKTLTVDVRAGKGAVRHYRAVKSAGPEDLVFQLVSRSAPRCPNNVLFKHIKPAAQLLGIGWVNWQVLRRSHATWRKHRCFTVAHQRRWIFTSSSSLRLNGRLSID